MLLGGKSKTDNFLCWHGIYVQDASCCEVLGRVVIPQCENISKNNAFLETSPSNVSIYQVGTVGVKKESPVRQRALADVSPPN